MAFKRSAVRSRLAPQTFLIIPSMFYLYIIKSKITSSYYIGHTKDVHRRLEYHNAGYNKSTKRHLPWELVYYEEYSTRSEAVGRRKLYKKK